MRSSGLEAKRGAPTARRRGKVGMLAWCCVLWIALWSNPAIAQSDYSLRTGNELYQSHVIGETLITSNPGEQRFWELDASRKYLASTYGEARVLRRFFVDIFVELDDPCLAVLLDQGPCGVPEKPSYLYATLYEPLVLTHDLQFVVRPELYLQGEVNAGWVLSGHLAARMRVANRTEIPPELMGRAIATRSTFTGLMPLRYGAFAGTDFQPAGISSSGLSIGGFVTLSQTQQTFTRASLRRTWWLSNDPFASLARLEATQTMTFFSRKLTAQVGGRIDLRTVSFERYRLAFGQEAPERYYLDLGVTAGALALLPYQLRLGINGQLFPYHTPDAEILRWYRFVEPQLSLFLNRRLGILELVGGYTLRIVPPHPDFYSSYEDSGGPILPGSVPAHHLSLTVGARL